MERIFGNIIVPAAVSRSSETAHITGSVPLPAATKRVVMTEGKVKVTEAKSEKGKVNCKGKLSFCAICEGEDGKLSSFTASADFSHSVVCESADTHMRAAVTAQLLSITAKAEGDALLLNAEADIMCRMEDEGEKRMLVKGPDTELQTAEYTYMERECVGSVGTSLREDIVANNISSVIYARGEAVIRDISCVMDTARVDGIISVQALCYDKGGEYTHLAQNIPFTAEVQTTYDNCTNLTGTVDVTDIRVRLTEEEYSLATVDARVDISLYSASQKQVQITCDAYSPTSPFDCEKTPLQLLLYKETAEQKGICKDSVKTGADFSHAVFCGATPLISSATAGEDCIILDGITRVSLLYADKNGELRSVTDNLPFSVNMPVEYANTEIDARPVCTAVNVGSLDGDSVEVSVSLHITADIYELQDVAMVTGAKNAEMPKLSRGFVICFASQDESVYDIAKRFNVSQAALRAANPDMPETLHSGDRAILLR
ncbi:MAG: DUF3794 domain-containing protein [Clostridia bacterium]|nr:DUF3794 domain-containing protein [Clostridia bacterium]